MLCDQHRSGKLSFERCERCIRVDGKRCERCIRVWTQLGKKAVRQKVWVLTCSVEEPIGQTRPNSVNSVGPDSMNSVGAHLQRERARWVDQAEAESHQALLIIELDRRRQEGHCIVWRDHSHAPCQQALVRRVLLTAQQSSGPCVFHGVGGGKYQGPP